MSIDKIHCDPVVKLHFRENYCHKSRPNVTKTDAH